MTMTTQPRLTKKERKRIWMRNERLTSYGWARSKLRSLRYKAKQEGKDFNLELWDILPPDICPVLGVPLQLGPRNEYNPSVDKINPALGYVKGNVRVISNRANRLKDNASVEELTQVLADAVLLRKRGPGIPQGLTLTFANGASITCPAIEEL